MAQKIRLVGETGITWSSLNLTPVLSATGEAEQELTGLAVTALHADQPRVYEIGGVNDSLIGDYAAYAIGNLGFDYFGFVRLTGVADAIHWTEVSLTAVQNKVLGPAIGTGETLRFRRGDSNNAPFVGLGDLTGFSQIFITGKKHLSHSDDDALFQLLRESDGTNQLLRINGNAPAGSQLGTIQIDDLLRGNIVGNVNRDASTLFPKATNGYYDVDIRGGASDGTRRIGRFEIELDVTRTLA